MSNALIVLKALSMGMTVSLGFEVKLDPNYNLVARIGDKWIVQDVNLNSFIHLCESLSPDVITTLNLKIELEEKNHAG